MASAAAKPKFAIDYLIEAAQQANPDCPPGMRMIAGRASTYNGDLLWSFQARETVRNAVGVEFWRVSDETLGAVVNAALRRWADTKHRDEDASDVLEAAIAEQKRRASALNQEKAA